MLYFFSGFIGLSTPLASSIAQPMPWPLPLPQIANAYCAVPTYRYDAIPYRGLSTILSTIAGPQPVIFLRVDAFSDPNLLQFIIAHECGHHVLGRVVQNAMNPYAAMWMHTPEELGADCWAAHTHHKLGNLIAIQAAIMDATMHPDPSLPNRTQNIANCNN
jgi:hypothetical protein